MPEAQLDLERVRARRDQPRRARVTEIVEAEPARDPLKLVRVLLTCARRAGFPFEEAYDLAASTSLAYMSDRRAEEGWEALARNRAAWADAYGA